jgi:phosphoribosyl 1,2-cyclic phosphate phosphodiesterase
VLGCGSSGGVPLPTGRWGRCDPENPRNRRRRSSILLEIGDKTILVDTGPDLRDQLLTFGPPEKLDAVILTHYHADHLHGIDDIRHFVYKRSSAMPVFLLPETEAHIRANMRYIFEGASWYPPLFEPKVVEPSAAVIDVEIEGLTFQLWRQPHSSVDTIGLRIGGFAYSTDCVDLAPLILDQLRDWRLQVWMADAVRIEPHPAHAHLEMTKGWMDHVQPERGLITHMSEGMDYEQTHANTQDFVEPAYDGLVLEVDW